MKKAFIVLVLAVLAVRLHAAQSEVAVRAGLGFVLNDVSRVAANDEFKRTGTNILVQCLIVDQNDQNLKYGLETGYMSVYSYSALIPATLDFKYTVSAIPLSAVVKYEMPDNQFLGGKLYGMGSVGLNFVTSTTESEWIGLLPKTSSSETKTAIGIGVGGGLKWKSSETADVDASVRYTRINADDNISIFQFLVGVSFNPGWIMPDLNLF